MNLVEATAREIARVSKLVVEYENLGETGTFGKTVLERSIENACVALGNGDVADIAACLTTLRSVE